MGRTIRIRSIVPGTGERVREAELESKRRWGSEGVRIETVTLAHGPRVMESEYHMAYAAQSLLDEVARAEHDGVNAIILDCFLDPMIDACRQATAVPIVGPGQAGIMVALCLGQRIGILSPNERAQYCTRRNMARYGALARISSWQYLFCGSIDLQADLNVTRLALRQAAGLAQSRRDCDVLLLGCTGLGPFWEDVRDDVKVSIPVVDPFLCAVKLAELLALGGLSHSPSCYPRETRGELR